MTLATRCWGEARPRLFRIRDVRSTEGKSGCSSDGRGSSPLARRVEIAVCCKGGDVCVASRMIKRVVSLTSALNYSRYVGFRLPFSFLFFFSFRFLFQSGFTVNSGLPSLVTVFIRGWNRFIKILKYILRIFNLMVLGFIKYQRGSCSSNNKLLI